MSDMRREAKAGPADATESANGRWSRWPGRVAVSLIAAVVLLSFGRFHDEATGWTYLLDFGTTLPFEQLPETEALPVYRFEREAGYDAQLYAQLALRPDLRDPALLQVIDNPVYRARRMLLPWLAAWVGDGDPWRTLNAYALLNLVAWCGLGVLLVRWIDIGRADGVLRWCGVMLSAGMLGSLRHALTDGPALLAVAGVVALVEARRSWLAAVAGGVAGMVRETGILAAAALLPARWPRWREWWRVVGMGAVVVLPITLWIAFLRWHWAGHAMAGDSGGLRNLAWPLVAYAQRWHDLVTDFRNTGGSAWVWYALCSHLGLTVQAAFLVCVPRWRSAVWRVGAAHVLLMAVLNTPVWEGYPGAAARVLLPMTFAFNVLAPRGRLGLVLLIVGNLGIAAGIHELRPPPGAGWRVAVTESAMEKMGPEDPARALTVRFDSHVWGAESHGGHTWRWTDGDAVMTIRNAAATAWRVSLRLGLRSVDPRPVTIEAGDRVLWQGAVSETLVPVAIEGLVVPPGGLDLTFRVGEPSRPLAADSRPLGAAIYDVVVEVLGTADASP